MAQKHTQVRFSDIRAGVTLYAVSWLAQWEAPYMEKMLVASRPYKNDIGWFFQLEDGSNKHTGEKWFRAHSLNDRNVATPDGCKGGYNGHRLFLTEAAAKSYMARCLAGRIHYSGMFDDPMDDDYGWSGGDWDDDWPEDPVSDADMLEDIQSPNPSVKLSEVLNEAMLVNHFKQLEN